MIGHYRAVQSGGFLFSVCLHASLFLNSRAVSIAITKPLISDSRQ
tara:strand:- start:410 stop:544 length:135 start_codon:yes stop_codon:yes gene_type:complete